MSVKQKADVIMPRIFACAVQEKLDGLYFLVGAEIKKHLPAKGWQPIDPKVLDTVFEHTYRAASKATSRYFMNGVNLENAPGGLRGIATDGRHLALVEVPCKLRKFMSEVWVDPERKDLGKCDMSHVVPLQYIPAVRKFLKQAEEWEILIKNTYIALRSTDGAYTAKASFIDGRFPNYRRVIPDNYIGGKKLKILQAEAEQVENALRELKKSPLYRRVKDAPWEVWFKADSLTELILEMRKDWKHSKEAPEAVTKSLEIWTQEDPVTELMNGFHLEHACASIKGTMQFEWEAEGRSWQIKPVVLEKGLSRLLFVIAPLGKHE
jgi:hypothetical protein